MNFKKIAFYTLGCKVNQYETESLKKQGIDYGLEVVDFEEKADIYIVNSCTVTSIADRKTRNMLRRAKKNNNKAVVIATGCYAQTNAKDLEEIEEIDFVVGNTDKTSILKLIENIDKKQVESNKLLIKNIFEEKEYEELEFSTLREMSRAYIKIQDGCDNFCSYCKIPFARGAKRSRQIESVIEEARLLGKEGFKEIILIGINLGAYGEDFDDKKINLEILLEELVKIKEIERIRLGSIYPDKINDKFINLLKSEKKIMPHLHISLQSGDNKILSLMNRKYTQEDVLKVFAKLRKEVPNIEFTGDVIVGFPQELEENYINTYNLIKEISFSDLHIFQYSDRENTQASTYTGKIPSPIKKRRLDELECLRKDSYKKIRENYIGKEVEILVEEVRGGKAYGYTENYIKVELNNYSKETNKILKLKVNNLVKEMLTSEYKN